MEIKVLGTVAPYPKGSANCSGFLVSEGDNKILLDCGPGSTRYLDMLKDLKNLVVFISHYHPDHYGDLLALMYATYTNHNLGYLSDRVPIYLPRVYREAVACYNEYGEFSHYGYEDIIDKQFLTYKNRENYVEFKEYHYEQTFNYGDMQIEFAYNPHTTITYSTRISSPNGVVVYSSDTGYERNKIEKLAKDADILICEASYLRGYDRREDTHLFAHEAGKIAAKANVKNLYLFHTYPEIDKSKYVEEAKEYFENTNFLTEGEVIKLERRKENE